MSLDEYQQMFRRMERRMRDTRVVEVLSNIDLSWIRKRTSASRANLKPVAAALKAAKMEAKLEREEEHEAWNIEYIDPMQAPRTIGVDLLQQPEYRRMRAIGRQVAKYNQPPFTVLREGRANRRPGWRELLEHVKSEGTREVYIQRYKGLGEMNAEQLWATTMNAETRTLLRVELEDLARPSRSSPR